MSEAEPFWPDSARAPVDNESWKWADNGAFEVIERGVASRIIEAIEPVDSDGDGFMLGNLRAALAAAADYPDDAYVRVVRPKLYELDDGRDEHWFDGIVIEHMLGTRRAELMKLHPEDV
ncbi:hypothetical protein FK530_22535 [Tsukamurella conjunctivitidis]|uniref:Uncharacterized protein n=1 Tax=Tsukamurella conjunctivitidis TaxID=2592068 RepID=A0A5C5RRF5_9ACTN|nr:MULTISPECIES: hypothetical protein [Tsukamurella]RDB48051.1 hypothetical protein DVB87_10010 [Tsukamurella tyrosinosolvens]TWS25617.1 hypothetical protein FK530_22535 [Tsukamurella conjunctivitidis]